MRAICVIAACVCGVAAVQASPPAYRAAVDDAHPLVWYGFEQASGPVLNHGTLGASMDATVQGNVVRSVVAPGGDRAMGFTSGGFLESASAIGLTGNPTFSIECMVRLTSPGPASLWGPFLHWGDGGPGDRTGREVYFGIQNANNSRVYAGFYNAGVRTGSVPVNQWMHLVWTRQGGSSSDQGSRVYINGQLVSVSQDTDLAPGLLAPNQIAVTSTALRVNSGRDFLGGRYFTGALDELALYDRVLDAAEIASRAALGVCRADFNGDSVVNSQDFFDFLSAFFAQQPSADFNGDAAINSQDFFDFLGAFFTGCG